ncbi:cation:proton antiporter domain-containing protein [Aureivirga marina]|uniref:cation:proton antiporter domain-containing protein n=1 Tax=Aureivirga marina TaxID=1182451 RepID=UPI0018CA8844|nr:cation:proton antiporter [Aureivirga marina]
MDINNFILSLIGFLIIAISANQISKYFQKIKFPIITGLIISGIIAGSSMLNFITTTTVNRLNFLNEIALAIIAFSAGSELYLDDLRSRINSIKWMTIGQLVITFVLSSIAIYMLTEYIPFMQDMNTLSKIAVAILFGTIFVARSPSSAVAVINEMRANGPFTKTVMGVTVVKDVLVIILFAICFSIAKAFINGDEIGFLFMVILLLELLVSFAFGIVLGKILQIPFSLKINNKVKAVIITILGYGVYVFSHFIKDTTEQYFEHGFVLEPLLVCIIGSFVLTNYSKHRIEFAEIIEEISPIIYIVFFTLTGASLEIKTLLNVFGIAVVLFLVRLGTMFIAGIFGVYLAKDPKEYRFIAWMPYLTQAGVALGLATIISHEFPTWGHEFETIIIAIIVINQLLGPPLFKWSLNFVKESHLRAKVPEFDGNRDALIFGLESQSIALAQQLVKNKWSARIATLDSSKEISENEAYEIKKIDEISLETLNKLKLDKTEVVVLMLSDSQNYKLAELIYENIGTKDIIVRLNKRDNFDKFHKLGAIIIEPTTAMVSLLDHFVRSPNAASLLLGMDEGQDSMDIEIRNNDIHGMRLRELRLPTDILVLSVKRNNQLIVSHGYTRLRIGDIMTLVGAKESLEAVKLKFEN